MSAAAVDEATRQRSALRASKHHVELGIPSTIALEPGDTRDAVHVDRLEVSGLQVLIAEKLDLGHQAAQELVGPFRGRNVQRFVPELHDSLDTCPERDDDGLAEHALDPREARCPRRRLKVRFYELSGFGQLLGRSIERRWEFLLVRHDERWMMR